MILNNIISYWVLCQILQLFAINNLLLLYYYILFFISIFILKILNIINEYFLLLFYYLLLLLYFFILMILNNIISYWVLCQILQLFPSHHWCLCADLLICRYADMPVVGHRHVAIAELISQYCNAIKHSIFQLGSGQHCNHIPWIQPMLYHFWIHKLI